MIFLGVVIYECFTWNEYIDSIAKKIIKSAGVIAKIRHYTNLNTLKLIYYALVYPYLIYCYLIWCNNLPIFFDHFFIASNKIHKHNT